MLTAGSEGIPVPLYRHRSPPLSAPKALGSSCPSFVWRLSSPSHLDLSQAMAFDGGLRPPRLLGNPRSAIVHSDMPRKVAVRRSGVVPFPSLLPCSYVGSGYPLQRATNTFDSSYLSISIPGIKGVA